jgi:hypothetical protein
MTTVAEACALELVRILKFETRSCGALKRTILANNTRDQASPTRTPPEPTVTVETCGSSPPAGSSGLRLNDVNNSAISRAP